MRVFISHRFAGEDTALLKITIAELTALLSTYGHETYCSMDSEDHFIVNKYTVKQIMDHALQELDKSDMLLALVTSENKSEGMLIEVGYALAKGKKIVLIKKPGSQTSTLDAICDTVIEFENIKEIKAKLNELTALSSR